MNDSQVTVTKGSTAFVGADATRMFAAFTLKQALLMYADCKIIPNRHWTPTRMLAKATEYTGKTYKRGQYRQAGEDVRVWYETMKAAMPVEKA